MQITDRVRRRLAESQTVIGVGTSLNSALSVEYMVGSMDLDFIVVDMQHSDIDSAHAVHMLYLRIRRMPSCCATAFFVYFKHCKHHETICA